MMQPHLESSDADLLDLLRSRGLLKTVAALTSEISETLKGPSSMAPPSEADDHSGEPREQRLRPPQSPSTPAPGDLRVSSQLLPSGPSCEWTVERAPADDFADLPMEANPPEIVFFPGDGGAQEGEEDEQQQASRMRSFDLQVVYDPLSSGLEEAVNFPIAVDTVIAGRYKIRDYLGSGVFSRAVQCVELATGRQVCVKIIRNNKDFVDLSLGEIKLLRHINEHDPHDENHTLRMLDFFYHREHLFIVSELLRDNLYELYKYIAKSNWPPYFTLPRVRCIGRQVVHAYPEPSGPLREDGAIKLGISADNGPCTLSLEPGFARLAADSQSAHVHPFARHHSLRPQAREHTDGLLLALHRQAHRLWLVVLRP